MLETLAQGPRGLNPPSIESEITNPALGEGLQGLSGAGFFQKFFPAAIGLGFVIGVVLFFFIMIIGAIQWITSGGDKTALESARGKIINAVIGIIVLFALYALISLLETFFGINIKTLDIGPLKIE